MDYGVEALADECQGAEVGNLRRLGLSGWIVSVFELIVGTLRNRGIFGRLFVARRDNEPFRYELGDVALWSFCQRFGQRGGFAAKNFDFVG